MKNLNYKAAGVNIDAGNDLVDKIKTISKATHREGVLSSIGGFAACFEIPVERYRQPVLVSSTDGVGTKLKLCTQLNAHEGIGIDLVAMCVNDLICQGAEPLYFLDYYATGQLQVTQATEVIKSIAKGCQQANMALVGGETAEMPGVYSDNDYDLAGFSVGIIEKEQLQKQSSFNDKVTLIALASSGLHANGFSLVRHIIEQKSIELVSTDINGIPLADLLLEPTRIYVKSVLPLFEQSLLLGAAHITGGGLLENIPRMLPEHSGAIVNLSSWEKPAIFSWLQEQGQLSEQELYRTFNCGVGMVLCVEDHLKEQVLWQLRKTGETAWVLGHVESSQSQIATVTLK